jgi:hypothetical protein
MIIKNYLKFNTKKLSKLSNTFNKFFCDKNINDNINKNKNELKILTLDDCTKEVEAKVK